MSAPTPGERDIKAAREIANECAPTHAWAWCSEKLDTNCPACRLIWRCAQALALARQEQREADARIAERYERAEQEPQYKIIAREIAVAILHGGAA